MSRTMIAAVIAAAALMAVGGCSGIWADGTWTAWMDRQAAWSYWAAVRAESGEMDANGMRECLLVNAQLFGHFRAVRHGGVCDPNALAQSVFAAAADRKVRP